jgi:hypothetical protein
MKRGELKCLLRAERRNLTQRVLLAVLKSARNRIRRVRWVGRGSRGIHDGHHLLRILCRTVLGLILNVQYDISDPDSAESSGSIRSFLFFVNLLAARQVKRIQFV